MINHVVVLCTTRGVAYDATPKGVSIITNKLAYYRDKAGLTRKALGDMIGVDRTLIWRYEKGKCKPRDETKIKIAKALGETVEEIFFSVGVALKTTGTDG